MKNIIYFLKIAGVAGFTSLIFWNIVMLTVDHSHRIPQSHKEVLLTVFLLTLFAEVFRPNVNDDDWAGQF